MRLSLACRSRTHHAWGSFAAAILLSRLWPGPIVIAQAPSTRDPVPPSSDGRPVLVELFTSQGCSTCPPADRLLTELGQEKNGRVVPLSFHVDFWNHDGWVDPFSRHEWTERQVAYARVFGLRQVYTPQAVVEGGREMVGSDGNQLRAAVAAAASRPSAEIALQVEQTGSQFLIRAEVDRPDAVRGRKLDLMLAVFETGLVTSVGRGENSGRTLRNDYVVRTLRRGARLGPGGSSRTTHTATLSLEKDWKRSQLGVAAFLQDPTSLEIFGAASRSVSSSDSNPK